MVFFRRRKATIAGLLMAGLALVSGAPAWGANGNGLKKISSGRKGKKGTPGHGELTADDILDFSDASPKDCASYLCVSNIDAATEYIEAGCPGQFSNYQPEADEYAKQMPALVGYSSQGSSGVSTGTLFSLAGASGILAIGVGFMAGYKASPSFAYMRIPTN